MMEKNTLRHIIIGVLVVLVIVVSVFLVLSRFEMQETKLRLENELALTKNELTNTEIKLSATETELSQTVEELNDTTLQLNDTTEQLNSTNEQLELTETRLQTTEQQLKSEISRNNKMVSDYKILKDSIDSRVTLSAEEMRGMVTPGNLFVSNQASEIAGTFIDNVNEYWRDWDRLYRWVVNNISYSSDSPVPILPESLSEDITWHSEYWRSPEETLLDKTGDCEDMSLLLASLIKSYNEPNYSVWCVRISSDIPGVSGHMGVAFPVANGNITILDPAGNYYTGYLYGRLSSETASIEIKKWISNWTTEIPGAKISAVFSDDMYEEFASTTEFLEWFADR